MDMEENKGMQQPEQLSESGVMQSTAAPQENMQQSAEPSQTPGQPEKKKPAVLLDRKSTRLNSQSPS